MIFLYIFLCVWQLHQLLNLRKKTKNSDMRQQVSVTVAITPWWKRDEAFPICSEEALWFLDGREFGLRQ